ncbi:MAG: LysR family transcriptional regulator [Bryobacteraceae bacterium]
MEVRQLQLFLAVLDCTSVTRAAERVNLTPGAVSLQLHSLAAELSTELFVRSGKRLAPTAAAWRLAERAREVINQLHMIQQEFESDAAGDRHPFHFATGATALIHHLGAPLRRLRKQFPHLAIDIMVCPTEEMVAGLLDRRFDLALISLPYPNENVETIPLFEEELLVLKPSLERISGWHVAPAEPAELAKAPFVLYPRRSNMRSMIDGFFKELAVTPRVVMEADDTEALRKLVETGFGYSILPEYALHGRPRYFHALRVKDHRLARVQALAMARSQHRRALTDAVARFLQTALAAPRK